MLLVDWIVFCFGRYAQVEHEHTYIYTLYTQDLTVVFFYQGDINKNKKKKFTKYVLNILFSSVANEFYYTQLRRERHILAPK